MENFEMEWKNIVRTIKINATVEEREKIEELKKLLKEVEHKKKKIDDEDEDEVVEEDEDEQQKTTKERKKATVVATGGRRSPLLHKFPPDGTAVPGPSASWYLFQFQKREEEREKIEELKKLLKEAWKEKSEYAKEVEVLKEKVFGLETNIKILNGETIKYLDNGD